MDTHHIPTGRLTYLAPGSTGSWHVTLRAADGTERVIDGAIAYEVLTHTFDAEGDAHVRVLVRTKDQDHVVPLTTGGAYVVTTSEGRFVVSRGFPHRSAYTDAQLDVALSSALLANVA